MLDAQHELQLKLGNDYAAMTVEERVDHCKEMILACEDELHEALNEMGWKSWATSKHLNAEAAFGELRDAWQFLTNAMFAVSQFPPHLLAARLHAALLEKLEVNIQRAENGYDGVSSKCQQCHRDLAEVELKEIVTEVPTPHVIVYCVCGAEVGRRAV